MVSSCEILIVGAGPAGAAAALAAARLGLDAVLVEKRRIPRYKCCAGGVPVKVAAEVRLDFSGVSREEVAGAVFSWKGADAAEVAGEELLGWVVDRAEFDAFLARSAASAGARLIEGTEVVGLEETGAGVRATTASGPIQARAAVVAAGSSSRFSRAFSVPGSRGRGFGLEARVVPPAPVWERYRYRLHFDFGAVAGGYSWIFPGPGFLNVGAAARSARAPRLPDRLREYLIREGLENWVVSSRFRGASLS